MAHCNTALSSGHFYLRSCDDRSCQTGPQEVDVLIDGITLNRGPAGR